MLCAASVIAFIAEAHTLLIVVHEVATGNPAPSAHWRAMFCPSLGAVNQLDLNKDPGMEERTQQTRHSPSELRLHLQVSNVALGRVPLVEHEHTKTLLSYRQQSHLLLHGNPAQPRSTKKANYDCDQKKNSLILV